MNNNVMELDSSLCTGCGTCFKACPKNSITIVRNKKGHYEPKIDNTCISCGLCKKVCYKFIEEEKERSIYNAKGYLMYNLQEEERFIASSGGIGKELTKYALSNGYTVVGVTYDYKFNNAKHIIIEDIKDLDKIVGSKYIPSYTPEALEKMDKDKKYLFIGSPCQVYGVKKLFEMHKFKDVILVDFFCHGTPSLNLWDNYLDDVKEKNNIDIIEKIQFRDKTIDWHNFSMVIEGENGNSYRSSFRTDKFMNCFLENVDLNNPCYKCKLRFNRISSDIRLGDFWGPKCSSDKKGTSIVLSSSDKGDNIIKSLANVHREVIDFDEIKVSQYHSYINIPKQRDGFIRDLQDGVKIDCLHKKYVQPIMVRKKYKYKIQRVIKKINKIFKR